MATFPKFADNQMNYYQFKAKQILLLKKEDQEWQEFCKQIAPDCAACLAEKTNVKESKNIGIQTFPKTPISKPGIASVPSRYSSEQIPKALTGIMTRLEKIDLELSKLHDVYESEKGKKPVIQERRHIPVAPPFYNEQNLRLFEEQRKLQIQNSLQASLQNLHLSDPQNVIYKKPPVIKPKNSGYFLPHDLQVKRAAARKTYLASLQTKPKVSFQTEKQTSIKQIKSNQDRKIIPTRKKFVARKVNQKSSENKEETLVEAFVTDDTKDENIESVVDAILEDLLGEAALDLNKIKQRKRERNSSIQRKQLNKAKEPSILLAPKTSFQNIVSKNVANGDNRSIMKLKLFLDSSEVQEENNDLRKDLIQLVDKSTSISYNEDVKAVHDKGKSTLDASCLQTKTVVKSPPKFICDVSHIIKIDQEKAKEIASKQNRFWRYLESISRTTKGDFNPWILNEMLAESILDDCISDIAEELSEMPSNFIQDLYNQEFVQQVEN